MLTLLNYLHGRVATPFNLLPQACPFFHRISYFQNVRIISLYIRISEEHLMLLCSFQHFSNKGEMLLDDTSRNVLRTLPNT